LEVPQGEHYGEAWDGPVQGYAYAVPHYKLIMSDVLPLRSGYTCKQR